MSYDALARQIITQLKESFYYFNNEDFPNIFYGTGKARVGSTPLTNVLGIAGIPSYYQPVKTILRCVLNATTPIIWQLEPGHENYFAKETFGPYTIAECMFLPVEFLLKAGFPAEKLHVVILDREPTSALASWIIHWAHRVPETTLIWHYIIATLNTRRLANYAKRSQIKTTTYVYELSKEPLPFLEVLFERLGIDDYFCTSSFTDWKDKGDLASENSSIFFLEEPQVYNVPGLHGSDVAYRFHAKPTYLLSEWQVAVLDESGLYNLYRESIQACIADFNIDRGTAEQIFDHDFL